MIFDKKNIVFDEIRFFVKKSLDKRKNLL